MTQNLYQKIQIKQVLIFDGLLYTIPEDNVGTVCILKSWKELSIL